MSSSAIRRFTIAATLAAGLISGLPAIASAEPWRPVPLSCASANGTGGQCATLRAGEGMWNVTVAPGGTTAYGAAWGASAVVIFDRNRSTGQLTQRAGTAGCASENGSGGQCADVRAVSSADPIVIGPGGKQVYVGGWGGGVGVFDRNVTTGALTQKAGVAGCFTADGSLGGVAGTCSVARGLGAARDIHISPDGANVYVGGDSIVVFNRNATTGALTQQAGTAGCWVAVAASGCSVGNAIGTQRQFSMSPDGRSLYGPTTAGGIAIFDRDLATGSLAQKAGVAGCITTNGSGGLCAASQSLRERSGLRPAQMVE